MIGQEHGSVFCGGLRNGQALVLSQGTQSVGGDQGRDVRASVQRFQARPLFVFPAFRLNSTPSFRLAPDR